MNTSSWVTIHFFTEEFELSAAGQNPDRIPFTALITYGGKPSDKFVGGTEGIPGGPFRVMIPPALLRNKIRELTGKRVFVSPNLSTHRQLQFAGKFGESWCDDIGEGLVAARARGELYRESDPDLIDLVVTLARQGEMGFSYDMKNVRFELKASTDGSDTKYIELTDFSWRGATILKRDAAAYEETELAAMAVNNQSGEDQMTLSKEEILKAVGEGIGPALKEFAKDNIEPLRTEFTAKLTAVTTEVTELKGKQGVLEAAVAAAKPAADDKSKDGKPADDKQKQAAVDGTATKLTASDFATVIANSVKGAIESVVKPVTEAVTKLTAALEGGEENQPGGVRKSLTASQVQVLTKYGDLDEEADPTVENYSAAIATIGQDARLGRDAKCKMIAELRASKNELIRAGRG